MGYKQTSLGVYPPVLRLFNGLRAADESQDEMLLRLLLAVDPGDLVDARMEAASQTYEDACRRVAETHQLQHLDLGLQDSSEQADALATDGGSP